MVAEQGSGAPIRGRVWAKAGGSFEQDCIEADALNRCSFTSSTASSSARPWSPIHARTTELQVNASRYPLVVWLII
ncbi:hypothetical protein VPH35_114096 [Triticum aestivum]